MTEREMTAGKAHYEIHDPFIGKNVKISNDLCDRLRGRYAVGPTMENGEPEFGRPPSRDAIVEALAGRNLACWCAPGAPCHADVLLEIANGFRCEPTDPEADRLPRQA